MSEADTGNDAIEQMRVQEEVLEICYWFQGEGFGDTFTPEALKPFLPVEREKIAATFERLCDTGDLRHGDDGYVFNDTGRRKAGKMFFDTFTEFQQASHGECHAGCCDGDEPCPEHNHIRSQAPGHGHGHAG